MNLLYMIKYFWGSLVRRHSAAIGLNVFLALIYFGFFFALRMTISDTVMFSTRDAMTYQKTSQEFYHLSEQGFSIIRPYLYPLIILISHGAGGAGGLWFIQFLFWIASINLIVLAVKRATGNAKLALGGGIFMAFNLSATALTAHALTETTTIFLLSALIYIAARWRERLLSVNFLFLCLGLLVMLALVKPLFFPLALTLSATIVIFYGKEILRQPKKLIILAGILLPMFLQIFIMAAKYNTVAFSKIGGSTFINYLLTQGISTIDHIDIRAANARAQEFDLPSALRYVQGHKTVYAHWYFSNLITNVAGNAAFVELPWADYMNAANIIFAAWHVIFAVPLIFILRIAYRKKDVHYFLLLIIPAFLTYYIFFTSGISAEQGDRLTLPALPLWLFMYALAADYSYRDRIHEPTRNFQEALLFVQSSRPKGHL